MATLDNNPKEVSPTTILQGKSEVGEAESQLLENAYRKMNDLYTENNELYEKQIKIIAELREKTGEIESMKTFLVLGFIILLVMFGGMIIDIWNTKGISNENLAGQINMQNQKLDLLIEQQSSKR